MLPLLERCRRNLLIAEQHLGEPEWETCREICRYNLSVVEARYESSKKQWSAVDEAGTNAPQISFNNVKLGEQYDRPTLAKLWGYASFEALSRGVVTPKGTPYIILFITKEKQESFTPYADHLDDDILEIEGPKDHGPDDRIINAGTVGDEIHLFYRERHHSPFTYYGQIRLIDKERRTTKPSFFKFAVNRWEAQAQADISTEQRTQSGGEDAEGEREGACIQRTVTTYERSPENRARALQIHGTKCVVCGFDFNAFYGKELAGDFIQVHHLRSISQQGNQPINPLTDLRPLCSNCHSMAHRKHGQIVSIEGLQSAVRQNGMRPTNH